MRYRTIIAIAVIAGTACESTVTGNSGNFQFSYNADDRIGDFNKPIAVGARLDISVNDAGLRQAVALATAETDDESVLQVVSIDGNTITLEAVGDGNGLLSVSGTTAEGDELDDSVNLLARTPEVLKLWHPCSTDADAAYVTGQRVWMPWEMEMENSQPVIGYGFWPVTVEGAAAHTAADSGQQWMAFDTGDTAGTATLTSDIDDTTLAMTVITESEIDGVEEPIAFVWEDIDVGDVNAFHVRPKFGGLTVCQADVVKQVVSLTPDICAVREGPAADPNLYEYGWYEIEGVGQGTCEYTVTYPNGADGAGVTGTFSHLIEP